MLKVDIKSFLVAKYPLPRIDSKAWLDGLACSQALYFLFRNGRVTHENKSCGEFIHRKHKGVWVGKRQNRRSKEIYWSN